MVSGDKWREQRAFVLSRLKDVGFGRSALEQQITIEVEKMIEDIDGELPSNDIMDIARYLEYASCVA